VRRSITGQRVTNAALQRHAVFDLRPREAAHGLIFSKFDGYRPRKLNEGMRR
jgi:hypothetical protein